MKRPPAAQPAGDVGPLRTGERIRGGVRSGAGAVGGAWRPSRPALLPSAFRPAMGGPVDSAMEEQMSEEPTSTPIADGGLVDQELPETGGAEAEAEAGDTSADADASAGSVEGDGDADEADAYAGT